jgi:hypothetical protein
VLKDSRTVKYFTRHKVIKIGLQYLDAETGEKIEEKHNWKIVATDKYSQEFLMDVYLEEWNDNDMEDAEVDPTPDVPDITQPCIDGPRIVYGFDTDISFSIKGLSNGKWVVNSKKVKIDKDFDSIEIAYVSVSSEKPLKDDISLDNVRINTKNREGKWCNIFLKEAPMELLEFVWKTISSKN